MNRTTATGVGSNVFINEIHYDNTGNDADEGIEVVAASGFNPSGLQVMCRALAYVERA